MRKQPYPVTALSKGLALSLDPTKIEDGQFCHLRNFDFFHGSLRRCIPWEDAFGSALSESPMAMDTFYLSSGSSWLILISTVQAYYYDPATEDWVAITDSDVFTGDEDNLVSTCLALDSSGADIMIINNGLDKPQKWEGPSGSWGDLGGISGVSLTAAKAGIVYKNHLILGGTVEGGNACPFRIRWSDTANPEEFVTGNAGFVDLVDTVDWVVALVLFKDQCFVFKERSIWEIVYVGEDRIFDISLVVDGVGTYSPLSINVVGENIFFYGSDNIYSFDGRYVKSIGDELISLLYDTETSIVNRANVHKTPAVFVEETAQYIVVVPTEHDYPEEAFVYDTVEESWSRRQLEAQCFGYWQAGAPVTWVSAKATGLDWDDVSGPWKSRSLSEDAPTTLRATYTSMRVYEDKRDQASGTTILRAEATTKIFLLGLSCRVLAVEFMCRGDIFSYAYSHDEGTTWSDWIAVTPESVGTFKGVKSFINTSGDTIQLKWKSESRYLEIKWFTIWYISRTRNQVGE